MASATTLGSPRRPRDAAGHPLNVYHRSTLTGDDTQPTQPSAALKCVGLASTPMAAGRTSNLSACRRRRGDCSTSPCARDSQAGPDRPDKRASTTTTSIARPPGPPPPRQRQGAAGSSACTRHATGLRATTPPPALRQRPAPAGPARADAIDAFWSRDGRAGSLQDHCNGLHYCLLDAQVDAPTGISVSMSGAQRRDGEVRRRIATTVGVHGYGQLFTTS